MQKDEISCIANKTKADTIGITRIKTWPYCTQFKGKDSRYDILQCDKNRNSGGVAFHIGKDLCFNTRTLYYKEIDNLIFDNLLPKLQPITIGVLCRPPNPANLMDLMVENLTEIWKIMRDISSWRL